MKYRHNNYKFMKALNKSLFGNGYADYRVHTNNDRKMHGKPMFRYVSVGRARRNSRRNIKFWEYIAMYPERERAKKIHATPYCIRH